MEGRINEADIVKLEEEIDQAIEAEDFQKLNELLDAREKLLPTLSVEMLKDIQKRDQQRKETLELKIKEFKESAEQMESGKKYMNSYIQNDNDENKGNIINRLG